jgi:hypothetical protein
LISPPPSDSTCGGTLGAWAVTVTGTYRGHPLHLHFGTCDGSQVDGWMRVADYTRCPGNFVQFTCTHGPYAFGKGHMRGFHPTVPNVVGVKRPVRAYGARRSFATKAECVIGIFSAKSCSTAAA